MKIKKSLLVVPLSLSLLAPMSAFAQSPDTSVTATQVQKDKLKLDQEKLAKSKAMKSSEEIKKLKEMGLDGKRIKLKAGEPLVINFDDGSRIEYELGIEDTPSERLPVMNAQSIVAPLAVTAASATYKTYNVGKQYFYGSANANTALYTDVRHEGRTVYVRSNFPFFQGTLTKNDWQKTRTIDSVGVDPDYATTELNGQFTTTAPYAGDYYTRTYLYRMDIDPAGAAYLRVIY